MIQLKKWLFVLIMIQSFAFQMASADVTNLFDEDIQNLSYYVPVGDIEGMGVHWSKLERDGILKWNSKLRTWDLVDEKAILLFNGDFMRRGPWGMRSVQWLLSLNERYPGRVSMVLGNHDGNILSFFISRPKSAAGLDPEYNTWLQNQSRTNTLASQIFYWAETMGLRDKVDNFWLELVLLKGLKQSPNELTLSPELRERFYTEKGYINREALSKSIDESQFAEAFYHYFKPGNKSKYGFWNLLKSVKEIQLLEGENHLGGKFFIQATHSAMSGNDNLGTIPQDSRRYVMIPTLDENGQINTAGAVSEGIEYQGKVLDPKDHSPENLRKFYAAGVDALHGDFIKGDLKALARFINILETLVPLQSTFIENSDAALQKITKLIEKMTNLELPKHVDQLWSFLTGGSERTDSYVYPPANLIKEDSLPAPADSAILAAEQRLGIRIKVGGHKPVGDFATMMLGLDPVSGEMIVHVFHDTSYSAVEGNNRIRIFKNGAVQIYGSIKDGTRIAMEYPSRETLKKWNRIKNYNNFLRKTNAKDKIGPRELQIEDRLDRYSRLGKAVDGRVIIGFKRKQDENGKWYTDYDEYMTVRQDGYKFEYLMIEVWALMDYEKNVGPLQHVVADSKGMADRAEARKIKMLTEKLGRDVITNQTQIDNLSNKDVVWFSGPAASISAVLDDANSKKHFEKVMLPAFENYFQSLPVDSNTEFLTGGTVGFEGYVSEKIAKQNVQRKKENKTPLSMSGNIVGVTGGVDIDPNIQKFLVLPNQTFYWNDYFLNLMKYTLLPSNFKKLTLVFAGGGGILPKQIAQAIEFSNQNPNRNIKIVLIKGLTIDSQNLNHKKRSGTDRMTDTYLAHPETRPANVSILEAQTNGTFKALMGSFNPFQAKKVSLPPKQIAEVQNKKYLSTNGTRMCNQLFSVNH